MTVAPVSSSNAAAAASTAGSRFSSTQMVSSWPSPSIAASLGPVVASAAAAAGEEDGGRGQGDGAECQCLRMDFPSGVRSIGVSGEVAPYDRCAECRGRVARRCVLWVLRVRVPGRRVDDRTVSDHLLRVARAADDGDAAAGQFERAADLGCR